MQLKHADLQQAFAAMCADFCTKYNSVTRAVERADQARTERISRRTSQCAAQVQKDKKNLATESAFAARDYEMLSAGFSDVRVRGDTFVEPKYIVARLAAELKDKATVASGDKLVLARDIDIKKYTAIVKSVRKAAKTKLQVC